MINFRSKLFSKAAGTVMSSTVGISVGITSTVMTVFGLFLIPISQEFNTSRASVSTVILIVAVTSALIYPVIGRLADRYGSRIVILVGNILFAASVASVSLVDGLYQLYLVYALIGITGSVLGPILFTKVIAGWFNKNRGFFLGTVSGIGNGVGSTVMPLIVVGFLTQYGWRGAFQGIALIILCFGTPILFFFLRDPPEALPSEEHPKVIRRLSMTFFEARQTGAFWLLLVSVALCAGCMMSVFIHVVPMLLDRGLPIGKATTILSTFALITVAGQICAGLLLDRIHKPKVVAPLFFIAMLGVPLFGMAESYPLLLLSAAMMGIGLGTEFGLLPYCISRYFGLKAYGAISGVMYGVVAITTGFLPVLMDVVFDLNGNYHIAMFSISLGMLVGTILVLKLPSFPTVVGAMEDFTSQASAIAEEKGSS